MNIMSNDLLDDLHKYSLIFVSYMFYKYHVFDMYIELLDAAQIFVILIV